MIEFLVNPSDSTSSDRMVARAAYSKVIARSDIPNARIMRASEIKKNEWINWCEGSERVLNVVCDNRWTESMRTVDIEVKDRTMRFLQSELIEVVPVPEDDNMTFDFGAGPVPAHRHVNPDGSLGGWVADTAEVNDTAYVGLDARVSGNAQVLDRAIVAGTARVGDSAVVGDSAWVRGSAWVGGVAVIRRKTIREGVHND